MDSFFVRAPYSSLSRWVELSDISQGLSNLLDNLNKPWVAINLLIRYNNRTQECSHLININSREFFIKRRPQGILDKCASDR